MLIIELVSDTDIFRFYPGHNVLLYINEEQFVEVRIAKVLNSRFFYIHIDGKKEKINKVAVIYKDA